jgi:hypothetical protein
VTDAARAALLGVQIVGEGAPSWSRRQMALCAGLEVEARSTISHFPTLAEAIAWRRSTCAQRPGA